MGERFVRLFVPLAFAIFFVTPIQVYFEWLQRGRIKPGYFEFYPSVYEIVPYPDGSFTWSHMWFVAYLFVFTILLLPLFSLAKMRWFDKLAKTANTVFEGPAMHFLLAVPFVAYIVLLFVDWPEQGSLIDDWYVFSSSMTFYLFGFLLGTLPKFWESCLKHRRLFLTVALTMVILLMTLYYWNWEANRPEVQDINLYTYALLNGFHIWSTILAAIGYAMRYLNFANKNLSYLNTAVYPFYILHQAIIVGSGYYILQLELGIFPKMMLLVLICLAGIWLMYHFIIRKTVLTRILFGMRWNHRERSK